MRILLTLLIAVPLCAQDAPPPGAQPKGGARPAPKNLKLLKPEEIRTVMGAFRVALGQQCTFCHVEGNFAADDKPEKEMARKMIVMTRAINANFPGGGDGNVTCYTCHRGDMHPLTKPGAAPEDHKPPAE